MLAAREVAVDVVKALHRCRCCCGCRAPDGMRVVVVEARHEGTDHKIAGGEGLVHGRWLMHPAGNGLEVVDAKGIG